MQVIGKDYDGIDIKWPTRSRQLECAAKQFDSFDQEIRPTITKGDREEIRATRLEIASITDHVPSLGWFPGFRLRLHPGYELPFSLLFALFAPLREALLKAPNQRESRFQASRAATL